MTHHKIDTMVHVPLHRGRAPTAQSRWPLQANPLPCLRWYLLFACDGATTGRQWRRCHHGGSSIAAKLRTKAAAWRRRRHDRVGGAAKAAGARLHWRERRVLFCFYSFALLPPLAIFDALDCIAKLPSTGCRVASSASMPRAAVRCRGSWRDMNVVAPAHPIGR